jgi:glycerophosphoryl diester phosphodiesterase
MAHPLTDPARRLVIAHRGDRAHAPENTIEAFTKAVALGVDGIEFDVRMTRDGVAVLMHDATVDRTTSGRGLVREQTLAELRTLDASRAATGWTGGRALVPTLEEVLDRFRGTPIIIDVKEYESAIAVETLVHKFGLQGSVVVGSDDSAAMTRLYRSGLEACASRADAVVLMALSIAGFTPPSWDYSVLSITPRPGGIPVPVLRMTELAKRMGVATHVWTVNDPAEAVRYWQGGVSSVLTDDPEAIIRAKPK